MMTGILFLVLAYLAGSIPSGLIIGKVLYQTDPREYGSHNTGATNAYRVFGAVGGLLVLLCDVAKGMLGVYLGSLLPSRHRHAGRSDLSHDCRRIAFYHRPFMLYFSEIQRR